MSPLDIVTLKRDQFYYALTSAGRDNEAYIVMPRAEQFFNKDRYNLGIYIKRNDLIVTEVTSETLTQYGSIDYYLSEEWGLKCYGGPITVGTSESLYVLNPL